MDDKQGSDPGQQENEEGLHGRVPRAAVHGYRGAVASYSATCRYARKTVNEYGPHPASTFDQHNPATFDPGSHTATLDRRRSAGHASCHD